jgi:ABC-type nitrate/sulfonate/bicarbonate transport system substrate-binding protein
LVIARGSTLSLVAVIALLLSHGTSAAADLLKLAIGQRGLWDSAIAEIGVGAGIFQKHNLELQTVYTSGGGETQQAVISGSVDIGVSPGMLGLLGAYAKGAPVRVIAGEATGTAEYYFVKTSSPRSLRPLPARVPQRDRLHVCGGEGDRGLREICSDIACHGADRARPLLSEGDAAARRGQRP